MSIYQLLAYHRCKRSSSNTHSGQGCYWSPAGSYCVLLSSLPRAHAGTSKVTAAAAAVDAVSDLLPQGMHVVGSYSSSAPATWQPSSNPSGVPAITASSSTSSSTQLSWRLNGQSTDVKTVTAASDAASVLQVSDDFVAVRYAVLSGHKRLCARCDPGS